MRLQLLLLLVLFALAPAAVSPANQGDGFVPMFNGKDLSGWVNVNCAPETFFVKDDMIITTGKPTGFLRTAKQYENFIAEFDWMHVPPNPTAVGNSGFFVWADPLPAVGTGYTRGIEVQVLVNLEKKDFYTSHGDLFSIWGASCVPDRPHPNKLERCLPSEMRCKGANEWNHYRVVGNDGAIKLSVNGKEVSGVSNCSPRKGYLALESEGSECRFKNLKIKELPSTNPTAKETADVAAAHVSIYNGLDLRGWKTDEEQKKHWKPKDGVLVYDGKAGGGQLATEKEFGDYELVLEWRLIDKAKAANAESGILLRGSGKGQIVIAGGAKGSGAARDYGGTPKLRADKQPGQWNKFRIRVKGDRVSVVLNDQTVLDDAQLLGLAERGPIGLQQLGDAVEFRNMFAASLGKDE